MYATRVTRGQGVILRRISWRGHFRLRDKDGGHTIRFAVAENPLLYANFTALSSKEPELLPIEFFALWEYGFSRIFAKNNGKYNISHLCCKIDADDAETHLLACYRLSSLYAAVVIRIQGVVLRRIGQCGHFLSRDKDGGHTIRSAVAENPLLRKLDCCIFYRTGVIAY